MLPLRDEVHLAMASLRVRRNFQMQHLIAFEEAKGGQESSPLVFVAGLQGNLVLSGWFSEASGSCSLHL